MSVSCFERLNLFTAWPVVNFCREVEGHRNVELTEHQDDHLIALLKEFRDLFSKKPAIFNDLVFKLKYIKSGPTDADFR